MKVEAVGKVGTVYTTKTGMRTYDFSSEEGENTEGWEQINETERRSVKRKRGGHSWVYWSEAEPHSADRPFNHHDDGPFA